MKKYEYDRIGRIEMQLEKAEVDKEIIEQIMDGGENILKKTSPKNKADWMREAMLRMNKLLDFPTRKAVREGCACCLGGKRLETSKKIAKENSTLEARIKVANKTPFVFGNCVEMQENGEVMVRFFPEGQEIYRCVCLPHADKPIVDTYCYCCGGHIKHHLQIALGKKLDCTVRHTALSTGGEKPCTFTFKILE